MRLSKIFLRWYKSFNTVFHTTEAGHPWELINDQVFPFVEIPLDDHITTIVGANESGKSHLLSAISKVFNGKGIGGEANNGYTIQDICRYCAFDSLDPNVFPNIGIEIIFEDRYEQDSITSFLAAHNLSGVVGDSNSVVVILSGVEPDGEYASVWVQEKKIGSVTKSQWETYTRSSLPILRYIDAKLGMSNEIHLSQLLAGYRRQKPPLYYGHLALNEVANRLLEMILPNSASVIPPEFVSEFEEIREAISSSRIGISGFPQLEIQLFRDILDVPLESLETIAKLGDNSRGYIEFVVDEINHRINERLDISTFWTQDEDLVLEVDYKSGFFFFQLADRTGSKFTFNERSSGLRHFLSYYIQSLAIKQSNSKRGSIVLMDEPDGYLSAVAQRDLLRVFESLVSTNNGGRCQLIYTTHSPFLVNRNFPQRVRLVRKGDSSEGTQHVQRSLGRQYEPIRSALGVESAQTLFMGSINIVLEGLADQKVLIAGIQRFGRANAIDETLDLNKVTFVSTNGTPGLKRLLQNSASGDEKKPIIVVLLDGDIAGKQATQDVVALNLIPEKLAVTLDELGIHDSDPQPKTIEDIIPLKMLAHATTLYLKESWNVVVDTEEIVRTLSNPSEKLSDELSRFVRTKAGAESETTRGVEIRGAIIDYFVDETLQSDTFAQSDELGQFEIAISRITEKLRELIDDASARYRQDILRKYYKLRIDPFIKTHKQFASKQDIARLLLSLIDDATIGGDVGGVARGLLMEVQSKLHDEVATARTGVDIARWTARLEHLRETPFTRPKNGW